MRTIRNKHYINEDKKVFKPIINCNLEKSTVRLRLVKVLTFVLLLCSSHSSQILCIISISFHSHTQPNHDTMSIHHSPPSPPTLQSIRRSLSDISSPPSDHRPFDTPRRFAAFANRLSQLLLPPLPQSPPVHTALKGLATELSKAAETLSVYNNGSKILVLVGCKSLCSSLQERAVAIAAWLALLASALPSGDGDDDLRKKVSDLARDMKLAQFRVPSLSLRLFLLKLK